MIGIIGISGKVGSNIAKLLENEEIIGFDIIESKFYKTVSNYNDFFAHDLSLVVDFSNSNLSKEILPLCIERKIKIISGTSNIPNLEYISKLAFDNKVSFVYLENFSKGIKDISTILNQLNCNSKEIVEEHYITKSDISQTALSLSKKINNSNISSIRSFKKQSNHYFRFYYDDEEVEIIHRCYNVNAYNKVFLEEYNKINSNDFYYKVGI